MTPGPNYTGQHDLFAAARPAAVMEVAAAVLIHPSPAKPAPVLEPPATRPRRDHALLVQVLGRSGDMCSDAPRVASELLNRFGDLRRTMTADVPDLASIVGDAAARDLRLSYDLALALLQQPLRERDVISSWEALKRYLVAALSGRTREAFHVLFLDGANRLVADENMGEGTVDTAPVYPREVVRRALQLEVSNLILAHYVARHIMDLMCPAPLCGPGGRLCFLSRVFGLQRAHNRKQVRRAPPPRPDRTGGCRADVRASRYRNARRQVSPYKELSQSINAASSCHPGLRDGAFASETGGSHSLRASAFMRRVISA